VRVDLFDYDLPAGRIAQEARPRGASRLLVLGRADGSMAHRRFAELPQILRPGDLLVRNDVRVRPARLYGRDREGRVVELFLLSRLDDAGALWLCLAKPGRRAKPGFTVRLEEGLSASVDEVREDGSRVVRFDRALAADLLERIGRTPLPPYIRREPGRARSGGGPLGLSDGLRARAARGRGAHRRAPLHGGDPSGARGARRRDRGPDARGRTGDVQARHRGRHRRARDGAEEVSIPAGTRAAVARAKRDGRRVVAVGTTVARSLEAASRREATGAEPSAARDDPPGADARFATDLFITPGFEFRAIDALLTNFHLPRSTLLMLVSAFAGRERVLAAYEEAKREGYLFYSFGDAMLIE
jgi:S-adenosylmethionine:tRNA ribosyltransferase-isomerase